MTALVSRPAAVAVIGEALIDLVPGAGVGQFVARPGGSPYNVAVGLARLDCSTALLARLASNTFGQLLRSHASAEGIDLRHAPVASEPTTLAVVTLDDNAQASYDFYIEGTADWQWRAEELAALTSVAQVVHFGSLASWLAPAAPIILDAVLTARGAGTLISYDPNVRPSLLGRPDTAVPLIESAVRAAHVVKASRDDVEWLYPARAVEVVARQWLELGPSLVVITDGADGARAFTASGLELARPGRPIRVVDTVGAGDSFTSGLLAGLVYRELHRPSALAAATDRSLADTIDEAIAVSALTCERVGADPPRSSDIAHYRR